MHDPRHWWRSGVVYQVYPRSFADSDGDGIGDIPGLIGRLGHLSALGVDAIWISPFYTSPLHDGGYDVADYRAIDPRLGTMDDVDALLREAHARDIRVLMDIVPNHTSSEHPWFREALYAGPGSAAWDRFVIRKGRGKSGEEPPNNWRSVFHGDAWSPMPDAAGRPTGYWYLHLFDTTQPDLDWENEEVRAEFDDILRFWFDCGIDGFRIDVAHGLVKAAGLPDIAVGAGDDVPDDEPELLAGHRAPYWDQPGVHDIYRRWRRIADEYDPPRIFCGEAWTPSEESLARYLRSDELHTCFNFQYLAAGWDASLMRQVIDQTIATHASVGAPPTWVLSNHDVIRHRTRMAPGFDPEDPLASTPDLARGLMRARAATLFLLALPGSAYLYQGEELGLPEVLDLDAGDRQDPAWHRSGGTDGFRDGCRVPIPWSGDAPSYGFGPASASWLPQPAAWAEFSVEAQRADDEGTLAMYRQALRIRRAEPALGEGPMAWIDPMPDGVLAIRRTAPSGPSVLAVINTGDRAGMLPAELGTDVLMASGDGIAVVEDEDGTRLALAGETAVWLRG